MKVELMEQSEIAVDQAIQWLLYSGIQKDRMDGMVGAVASWYDPSLGRYSYLYPEITGYAATTLIWLARIGKQGLDCIQKAKSAADWLIERAFQPDLGMYPYKYDLDSKKFVLVAHTFDQGIIQNGLLSVYRETNEDVYLDYAVRSGNILALELLRADGSLEVCRYLDEGQQSEAELSKWSRQSGPFLVKCVMGLLHLKLIDSDSKWEQVTRRICDWALTFQQGEGHFIINPRRGCTHTHPLCYTGEGLLVAGLVLKEQKYLKAAGEITKWLLRHQQPSGGIPRIFKDGHFAVIPERVDVLAQTIRLGILGLHFGFLDNKEFLVPIESAVTYLLSFQCQVQDIRQFGGFTFGFHADGLKSVHVNSWCTMFAIQTLWLYMQYKLKRVEFDPFLLV